MMLFRLLAFGLALAGTLPALASARAQTMSSRYDVSLIGFPVGRASFDTVIDGSRYSIKGTLASVGLADIVSKTSGTSRVAGRIVDGRLFADSYGLDYSSDAKSYSSDVALTRGRVRSAEVAPKVREQKADYVPVTQAQLRSVVDPLSGLMIMSKPDPDSLCQRTLPFFDGWSRLDLQLSPAGTKPFSTDGFEGDVIVCKVRIQPVSGYRATSRGVKFIQKQTIELWFAPIRDTGIFAPVYARIPTEIGPLTLRAATFGKG